MGPADLEDILSRLPPERHPRLLAGSADNDDAGVYKLRTDTAIVNTIDFFPPLVDDPFDYGRIAAANAMSDVFAMGGRPITVLNVMAVPQRLDAAVVAEILRGGAERAHAAGAVVVGGHTVADAELKYGMAVTGTVHPQRFIRNQGARRGDALVLTKPLGTGIVATAIKQRAAEPAEERAAVASMAALNDTAGAALVRYAARACTDVTGFGLAGHAAEMTATAAVRLEFEAEALPLLPGTAHLAESGYVTGGSRRTREYLGRRLAIDRNVLAPVAEAVIDPQTSGGLLVSLAARSADEYVAYLHRKGVRAAVVGRVTARPSRSPVLVSVA